ALVLPELLCELAEARLLWGLQRGGTKASRTRPLGVVLATGTPKRGSAEGSAAAIEHKQIDATAKLSAVNESARRYGVREGQSIAEACALVASLVVREVTAAEVRETLGRIAEVGLSLGANVAVEAPDTVCLDITGSAHLQGGEVALACEFANRVRGMGHSVRIAISDGPRLAQAFAKWFTPDAADPEDRGVCVVPSSRTVSVLSTLPLMSLPISAETAGWFMRLGVLTVGELQALPKQALGSRLGEVMASVSELCAGRDNAPLVAYTPERTVVESSVWDEPVIGSEPLLFVLGGLVSRVSARLTGRGEAAHSLLLTILYDSAIARFRAAKTEHTLRFKLAAPLHRADEIRRILSARVSRLKLAAPSVGLRLEVLQLLPAVSRQLELSQVLAGVTSSASADDEIPVLIAELASEIGEERVGTLKLVDSHRPEARSKLSQAEFETRAPHPRRSAQLRKAEPTVAELPGTPTRLLSEPYELHAPLRIGVSLAIDRSLYTIEHLRFEQRLEGVEWWGAAPVKRDYVRLWLQGASGGFEALAYVDRNTGRRYLQAVAD
ncbi:MAG TPA: DNA polymerase Y family protein, partial [Polyangiaceae bacterium]|nr:DNA polymerase Y family protein [Polyangiaceae bacterium]